MVKVTRRDCLKMGVVAGAVALVPEFASGQSAVARKETKEKMKLGLVTYNIAKDWDVPTIIEKCKAIGIEGAELRTTHAHGVEPSIGKAQRAEVRKRFTDAGVTLWGLGTVCEFHHADTALVREHIETCKAFTLLAEDIGAKGVKVRPNSLQIDKGIPEEKTLEQIGLALRECGTFAADHGIEIWLEVHGPDTQHPPRIKKILDICAHSSVGACWNSNPTDVKDGSVKEHFQMLRPYLMSCHINELANPAYPWRELFSLLKQTGYNRFTLAEIQDSSDSDRLLRYYRALWTELSR